MKKFILGFLCAAVLFSAIPAGAAIQEYILYQSEVKLMVDGAEISNPDLPILVYKGYNYIPAATFRDICSKIGVDFQWIGGVNQIQINTPTIQIASDSTSSAAINADNGVNLTPPPGPPKLDGIDSVFIDEFDGKYYIKIEFVNKKIRPNGYDILYNPKTEQYILIKTVPFVSYGRAVYSLLSPDDQILLDIVQTNAIPKTHIHDYIEVGYYLDTILPLIK